LAAPISSFSSGRLQPGISGNVARDTNFYYSFLVLPARRRQAIVAVWDFCRAVDDAVDHAAQGDTSSADRELARWRRELCACFEGREPETSQGRALAPLIAPFALEKRHFDRLIEGVEMDVHPRRYETFADLYEYCIRVASAVGLICLDIFGASSAAEEYATNLGVALQLTNILRDVPADLARGRVYIPLEDFRAHGCSESDLRREATQAGRGVESDAVKRLLAHQAERARDYYSRAARSLPGEEARSLVAAEIMGGIYQAILHRIETRDYDVFSEVARIPRPRRAVIAARVWARTMLWRPALRRGVDVA
jgi:phytoene synthase